MSQTSVARPRGRRRRVLAQALLGATLVMTGTGHLTTQRVEFRAQVPSWFPVPADAVVLASGAVEVALGLSLLLVWRQPARRTVGLVTAAFFVVIFPGNVAQLLEHRDAFGLDSDTARAVRLLFQPLLVLWAWWPTRWRDAPAAGAATSADPGEAAG